MYGEDLRRALETHSLVTWTRQRNGVDFLEKSRDKGLPTIMINVRCEPRISDYLALLRNYRSPNLIIVLGLEPLPSG